MQRLRLPLLRERVVRAARWLQRRGARIWLDGRARPEDRAVVDELTRAGNRDLVKKSGR